MTTSSKQPLCCATKTLGWSLTGELTVFNHMSVISYHKSSIKAPGGLIFFKDF